MLAMACSSNLPAKRGSFEPGLNFVGTRIFVSIPLSTTAAVHHGLLRHGLERYPPFTIHSSVITSTTTSTYKTSGIAPRPNSTKEQPFPIVNPINNCPTFRSYADSSFRLPSTLQTCLLQKSRLKTSLMRMGSVCFCPSSPQSIKR
jgi:hypothetical protein